MSRSHLTGEAINRFTSLNLSVGDLYKTTRKGFAVTVLVDVHSAVIRMHLIQQGIIRNISIRNDLMEVKNELRNDQNNLF